MCGFVGILDPSCGAACLEPVVRRMTAAVAHRGPDAEGILTRDGIALGHRRLSILDLSEAGAQPMVGCNNGPIITYNGEVYNFADLRRELEPLGAQFKGHSDTEVVLQGYAHWGLEGLR